MRFQLQLVITFGLVLVVAFFLVLQLAIMQSSALEVWW